VPTFVYASERVAPARMAVSSNLLLHCFPQGSLLGRSCVVSVPEPSLTGALLAESGSSKNGGPAIPGVGGPSSLSLTESESRLPCSLEHDIETGRGNLLS